ncbi:hypothetical protein [Frigidibacter oleivorans]|uniref:hypothetical protein n=1 Tax=Frigidibacter oleivorans TaxID=2487129 RepID=UPI000F8CA18D|nr:hypothetical protein [Frigidibacter oleivorans]
MKLLPMLILPIVLQSALLALESGAVIEHRMAMMVRGGSGLPVEAARMVGEKIAIAAHVWQKGAMAMSMGVLPEVVMLDTLDTYRRAVEANTRRLRG